MTGSETMVRERRSRNGVLPHAIGADEVASVRDRRDALERVDLDGEAFFVIRDIDTIPPFLMTLVSDTDLWAFVGSNGAFTAGRTDPDHALFPYQTVDKLLAHPDSAGALSMFHVETADGVVCWEPWKHAAAAGTSRHLYKHAMGSSVVFEEIRHDLGLGFRWGLELSERYGIVRHCQLTRFAASRVRIRYLDGFHQLLPDGVSETLYNRYSYLASAYMRHERIRDLGIFTLNSRVTDRAEPGESLSASCAWSIGHRAPTILLSKRQVLAFRSGAPVEPELEVRGDFGAWLVSCDVYLDHGDDLRWVCVADTSMDHAAVAALLNETCDLKRLESDLETSLEAGRRRLRARIAASDGLQASADPVLDAHHFANTAFNCMRGGIPDCGYTFPASDFAKFLRSRNVDLATGYGGWLNDLPDRLDIDQLQARVLATGDAQLIRVGGEYLPLLFSRRHGDPSRPWNRFSIRLRDAAGEPIFGYQGNWRDIFQNWESMARSYPEFLENMVAVFLNASTADGYNPYRITRDGFEWEVLDAEDPWSQIGYWGDHQIVYLCRLLEMLNCHAPGRIAERLADCAFVSARLPYTILGFDEILRDPRHSIQFDHTLHRELIERAERLGNDAKLALDSEGHPMLFSLAEKLLVPVLVKLSNLVPGGGIWLNTQRPEWNDANNALAGWGLSVVTVFHLHRHLRLLQQVFADVDERLPISMRTQAMLGEVMNVLADCPADLDAAGRLDVMTRLGRAGERHRRACYRGELADLREAQPEQVRAFLNAALVVVQSTLAQNVRDDGLVHSYNLLAVEDGQAIVSNLDLMLEGQAAAIGSGTLDASKVLRLLDALRHSPLYRRDQHSYLLQPDRTIQPFLEKNRVPEAVWGSSALIRQLMADGDRSLMVKGRDGVLHFSADFANAADLERRLDRIAEQSEYADAVRRERELVLAAWESVFDHRSFTGRSGAMFGFEGLGSIYWHMVAKLLLAVQEAHDRCEHESLREQLAAAYADVRNGLGFRKSADVYGAFPTDPYSHTPRHRGAQQPGMTGQVKEEILTRFGELGVRVENGSIRFLPRLMERAEFSAEPGVFRFVDVSGGEQSLTIPPESVAFTYCQVPVIYQRSDDAGITVEWMDGETEEFLGGCLPAEISKEIFRRSRRVTCLTVRISGV